MTSYSATTITTTTTTIITTCGTTTASAGAPAFSGKRIPLVRSPLSQGYFTSSSAANTDTEFTDDPDGDCPDDSSSFYDYHELDATRQTQKNADGDDGGHEEEDAELMVTFSPPLFLQRRIWILDVLRSEAITKVLDVGCGEGQLLSVLCQPAPWLLPPPEHVLTSLSPNHHHHKRLSTFTLSTSPPADLSKSPTSAPGFQSSPLPVYNDETIPSLHISEIYGLDVCEEDLRFAIEGTAPPGDGITTTPSVMDSITGGSLSVQTSRTDQGYECDYDDLDEGADISPYERYGGLRWEPLHAKVYRGGLEVINEAFVGIECIVSTEVIEHLPPNLLPSFAPMLLGVYHPKYFLVTTPSFEYNARFTAPDAPPGVRKGHLDPTGRTNRIFRHPDHKFEWTRSEFREWCTKEAEEWGYSVQVDTLGRATETDPWGRDDELGGATSWALFTRNEGTWTREKKERLEAKARETVKRLGPGGAEHTTVASHYHPPHPKGKAPRSLEEISKAVTKVMIENRQSFMRMEELWFERSVSIRCGGWIELLVKAIEECETLNLGKYIEMPEGGLQRGGRDQWTVELLGGPSFAADPWSREPSEDTIDCVPDGWIPDEGDWPGHAFDNDNDDVDDDNNAESAADGDISWGASEGGDETGDDRQQHPQKFLGSWKGKTQEKDYGEPWGMSSSSSWDEPGHDGNKKNDWGWGTAAAATVHTGGTDKKTKDTVHSSSSNAGWDGDASGETTS